MVHSGLLQMVHLLIRRSVQIVACLTVLVGPATDGRAQSQLDPYETAEGRPVAEDVIEGDLLRVGGTQVRLYGIDAPDVGQQCESRRGQPYDCGAAARNILSMFVRDRDVACTLYAMNADGNMVGRCFVGESDLSLAMVRGGWAFSYRSLSWRYESAQAHARTERSGIWSGRAEAPWVWRSQRLLEGEG